MPFPAYVVFGSDGLKQCTKCDRRLPAVEFSADKRNTVTGLQTWCRACAMSYRPMQKLQVSGTKRCSKCVQELPFTEFGYDSGAKTGLRSRCRKCHSNDGKERHRQLRGTEHYDTVRREFKLNRKYGIVPEDYEQLLRKQNGVCAICGGGCAPRRHFDIDHCHKAGAKKIRGLLCRNCNNAVGLFSDNLIFVERAILYLLSSPALSEQYFVCRTDDPVLNSGKKIQIAYKYGITSDIYLSLWRFQSGKCAICCNTCSTGHLLCVDHNSATGCVRGLLCRRCNMGLGKFKDNIDAMSNLRGYLDPNFSR